METPEQERIFRYSQWLGFVCSMSGALMLALKLPVSGWAYIIFTISDLCWVFVGQKRRIPGLVASHICYLSINLIGIYRWLL